MDTAPQPRVDTTVGVARPGRGVPTLVGWKILTRCSGPADQSPRAATEVAEMAGRCVGDTDSQKQEPKARGPVTILIAQPEPAIRSALRRIVSRPSVTIMEASTCALILLAVRRVPVDLIFVAARLPDGNGVGVLEELWTFRPNTKAIVVTAGDPSARPPDLAPDLRFVGFITTPFIPAVVEKLLENLYGPASP